jgi:hypothetical protein
MKLHVLPGESILSYGDHVFGYVDTLNVPRPRFEYWRNIVSMAASRYENFVSRLDPEIRYKAFPKRAFVLIEGKEEPIQEIAVFGRFSVVDRCHDVSKST